MLNARAEQRTAVRFRTVSLLRFVDRRLVFGGETLHVVHHADGDRRLLGTHAQRAPLLERALLRVHGVDRGGVRIDGRGELRLDGDALLLLGIGAVTLAAREGADDEQREREACDQVELQLRPAGNHLGTGAMTYSPNLVRTTIVDPRV